MIQVAGNNESAARTGHPVLWGAYLACSWTWCIGMFLPVLLLRDLGPAGFVVFAIPNVIGAAALGWIIQSKGASVRFVENHPAAVWWFSAVTLAFHMFWLLWVSSFIRSAFQIPDSFLAGVIGIAIAFWAAFEYALRSRRAPQLAVALLIFSLGVLIATFCTPDVKEANSALLRSAPRSLAPLWMLPVMIFGFSLCPYLDVTFHHARRELDTKKNGRVGFTLGFVGFFSFMILLTTRYAGVMTSALDGSSVPVLSRWLAAGILTHILCQWIFTVRVHLDRIPTIPGSAAKRPLLVGLMFVSGLIGCFAFKFPVYAGLAGGDVVYRCFMSAYGLVFPTYVLYRVIMAFRGRAGIRPSATWIAMALASPMFWLGFVEQQAIWLVPGVGILLLGAVVFGVKRATMGSGRQ